MIKKRTPFFWGAVLLCYQLTLLLIEAYVGFSTTSYRLVSPNLAWYYRIAIFIPALMLMAYSQYPRHWLGRSGRVLYKGILWVIRVKRSPRKEVNR